MERARHHALLIEHAPARRATEARAEAAEHQRRVRLEGDAHGAAGAQVRRLVGPAHAGWNRKLALAFEGV